MKLKTICGQPSWHVGAKGINAWITRVGGHLGPVSLDFGSIKSMPLSLNSWAPHASAPAIPAIVEVLRGDFFCMPFGTNGAAWMKERHPVHGETANRGWKLDSIGRKGVGSELRAHLDLKIRKGTVRKIIRLVDRHPIVYSRHVVEGVDGPMNLGHHAMLRFPSGDRTGLVATMPFSFGQVFPGEFENPREGGYSSLKPGAWFRSLKRVADRSGGFADLSSYPAREGYDDLVMLVAPNGRKFAWSAVTFPSEGNVWFSLKDPSVLRQTVLWHSNGGRHYYPWNGGHRRVLGLEEITGYFHLGLKESVSQNPISRAGYPTSVRLRPTKALTVNFIMGMAPIPKGFDHVARITLTKNEARLKSKSGKTTSVPIDSSFLHGQE